MLDKELDGQAPLTTAIGAKTGEHILSKSTVRGIVAFYLLLFLGGTTWPGATLFNTTKPLMLGLPFNLFVLAILIVFALVMLAALYMSETRN